MRATLVALALFELPISFMPAGSTTDWCDATPRVRVQTEELPRLLKRVFDHKCPSEMANYHAPTIAISRKPLTSQKPARVVLKTPACPCSVPPIFHLSSPCKRSSIALSHLFVGAAAWWSSSSHRGSCHQGSPRPAVAFLWGKVIAAPPALRQKERRALLGR